MNSMIESSCDELEALFDENDDYGSLLIQEDDTQVDTQTSGESNELHLLTSMLEEEESIPVQEKALEQNKKQTQGIKEKRSFCDAFGSSTSLSEDCSNSNAQPSSKKIQDCLSTKRAGSKTSDKASVNVGKKAKTAGASVASVSTRHHGPYIETEKFSRIRLKHRHVSTSELHHRMQSKTFVKLSLIRPTLKLSEETDWVTICVVGKQLDPHTAKNGKPFSIWHLTDLDDCTKHVSFFLFGLVHQTLWKEITVGTVIGLLNPSIMPPRNEDNTSGKSFDNTPALTVDVAERVMKIGVAADLGWCKATKFRNKKPVGTCLGIINKQYGENCIFHMQSKHKKFSSNRGELQGSPAAPVAAKYKNTLWNKVKGDQFFYGGQTFSAAPPSQNRNLQKKDSQMKLTKIFSGLKETATPDQKTQVERSKMMQAISGVAGQHAVAGCSETFAEMLASGDNVAGSRQFLNHLHKKEKLVDGKQEKIKSPSASAFLKEQKKRIEKQKMQATAQKSSSLPKVNAIPPVTFVSPDAIRKCTQDLVKRRKQASILQCGVTNSSAPSPLGQRNLNSFSPKLSASNNSKSGVDLVGDWLASKAATSGSSLSLAELRKRKALAKLRNESGKVEIKKTDPNQGVIGRVKDIKASGSLKAKVEGRVVSNRHDLQEKLEPDKENNLEKVLSRTMTEEDFNEILNATSSHSFEVELEEAERQEKYFKPLIQKEMLEEKMAETYEIQTKIVSCMNCKYTFWAPHERCKALQHCLTWKNAKKRFFQCTTCKQRTVTWDCYPARACRECGSAKMWKRVSMLRESNKRLESEVLLIRGIEHAKFLNALK